MLSISFENAVNKQDDMVKTGVIGAGIAGIAAAIRLALKGHQVTVFEANSYPGGKLSEVGGEGFRFDAGPSLFTMPELVDELFELAGEIPAEHFKYSRLPITCEYFFEDGTRISAYGDLEKFIEELHQKTGEPKTHIAKALTNSASLYRYLSPLFMQRSLHKISTFMNIDALKAYSNLFRLDFFRSMHRANSSFFKDPRVIQLFNRYATYNGSDPYQTPATMNIIPHLEYGKGAYFPLEGMHTITMSLFKLAKRLGVEFHFNSMVQKIITRSKKATGLQVEGEEYHFDRIVCNMDVVAAYRRLLGHETQPEKLLRQPKSSSALIFYWGIKKEFKPLGLHNIFFSRDYQKEFDLIFNKKVVGDDPTIYVNITSKLKRNDAPVGCENWFTMINVPHNSGQDWDQIVERARGNIQTKLERILQTDVTKHIVTEAILDPRTIESKTFSSKGALYGNSSNNMYAAFLRHANFSGRIGHLYFCGGSVHPGGGIPLSLLSAKITADLIR